ncbi:MAG: hypothetical protein JWM31_3680, partial [Solirubrobacterales bacterium]|nr:hypothetical protein [Solirubrobacterales bacterium]
RMRARIDIAEIETATKIRAKYLRALENEEWDLLPGPTFVKTFLRTYAEALGLDAKLLVEEYKLRHERLSDNELARPIGPTRATSGGRGRSTPQPVIPRSYVIGFVVLALCAVVFVLSRVGGGNDKTAGSSAPASTPTQATTTPKRTKTPALTPPPAKKKQPASTLVKLRIVATGDVYACLAAKGQPGALINGATLTPATKPKTYRSSRFRLVLGNENATLRIDGRPRRIPRAAVTTSGVFVQITKKGLSPLPKAIRPGCTA